jgi:uncharacterized protein DUF6933
LLDRFPSTVLAHLQAHSIPRSFAEPEFVEMDDIRVAKTASRSVFGVMNEFKYLAEVYSKVDGETDLLTLSLRLAETPCGRFTSGTSAPTASLQPSSPQSAEPRRGR